MSLLTRFIVPLAVYLVLPTLIISNPLLASPQVKVHDTRKTIAIAPSLVEISQQIKSVSVLIRSASGLGSGVIVQRQGEIYAVLTAAHAVGGNVQ
jgi:hypothetical protein